MPNRLKLTQRLFKRSRVARTVFVITVYPPILLADKVRCAAEAWREADSSLWRPLMDWARTGETDRLPTIPTSDQPAVVRRRSQPQPGDPLARPGNHSKENTDR